MHSSAYFHTRERVFAVSLYSLVICQILKLRIRQHFLYVVGLAGPCGKSALSKFRHIYPAIKYYPRIFPVSIFFHMKPRTSRHQNATHHTRPEDSFHPSAEHIVHMKMRHNGTASRSRSFRTCHTIAVCHSPHIISSVHPLNAIFHQANPPP